MKALLSSHALESEDVNPLNPSGLVVQTVRYIVTSVTLMHLVLASKTVMADTLIFRENKLTLPVSLLVDSVFIVMLDDFDATAFARLLENDIEFVVPFPEKNTAFEIRIIDAETGDSLYQQAYRKAGALDVFDSVDVETYGQFDSSIISQSTPEPKPLESFERNEAHSNLLVSAIVTGVREGFDVIIDVEAVNNSDSDARLRVDGPYTDISYFNLDARYIHVSGNSGYFIAGDTQMTSDNSLVNTGLYSRGVVAGIQTAKQRVKLEFGRFYGSDIVGAVHGPFGWSTDTYRTAANASIALFSDDDFGWAVNAAVLDVNRPIEDSFGIGQTPDGESNQVWGFGSDLSTLENRLRLNLNWASSRYDNPGELNFFDNETVDAPTQLSPGITSGTAWRHALSWDAWSGEWAGRPSAIGFELGAESATPFYRSVQGSSVADRRQWSASVNANSGPFYARLDATQFRNNLNNLISIHTLKESFYNANLTIDLDALSPVIDFTEIEEAPSSDEFFLPAFTTMDKSGIRALIPSSIDISAQIQDVKTLNGNDIILAPVIDGYDFMDQTSSTLSLSANWFSTYHSTTFEISRSFLDIDQRERAEADRRDLYYSLSHNVTRDHWSLGGRVSLSNIDDFDPVSRSTNTLTDWGIDGSYSTPGGINFSATIDNSNNRLKEFVFGDNTTLSFKRHGFSVDIGEWLGQKFNLKNPLSVTTAWQKSTSDEQSPFFDASTSSALATVNIGVTF